MPQASQIVNVPSGSVAATTVQGAINEIDSEKVPLTSKDATGGYAGLTAFKINFKNAANTFTSFFTNANTAARTYTFQDRDGTIADGVDVALVRSDLAASGGAVLIGWIQSGVGAVSRWVQDKLRDDVNILDYIDPTQHAAIRAGTSTYDATADVQKCFDANDNVKVKNCKGVMLGSPVTFTGSAGNPNRRITLTIEGGSAFKALAGFSGEAMVIFDADDRLNLSDFLVTGGGMIDCSNVAQRGVYVKAGIRSKLKNFKVKNATLYPIHVGDPSKTYASYEIHASDLDLYRDQGSNNDPSSIGCFYDYVTDSLISNVIPVGYRIGFKNNNASITYGVGCHPWSVHQHGPMTHGFFVNGGDTKLIGTYADTPHSRNFDNTVDGAITDVYGYYINALGVDLIDPKVFLSTDHAVDNTCTAVWINDNTYGIQGAVVSPRFSGGNSTTIKYKAFITQNGRANLVGVGVSNPTGPFANTYDSSNMNTVFFGPVTIGTGSSVNANTLTGNMDGVTIGATTQSPVKGTSVTSTTQSFGGDGSAALPSYAFTLQGNTGFYRASSGAVKFSSNGSDALQFDSGTVRHFSDTGELVLGSSLSTAVHFSRDGSNISARRNGTTPQIHRDYNTYTNSSNGEWVESGWASNVAYIYGDANGSGVARTLKLGASGKGNISQIYTDYTNTATVGAVTINKMAGRVNIAASGTSVVVTNSLVTAASHVIAVMSNADTTGRVTSVVPAAGSFTINTVAVTAQASFDFFVINAD